jgi:hypothetical protein
MQALYKDFARSSQALDLELLELSTDDIIGNVAESEQFRKRLTFGELRRGICQDYETGCVDAMGTIRRLEIGGLLTSPEDFCAIYCAGVRALEEGARS